MRQSLNSRNYIPLFPRSTVSNTDLLPHPPKPLGTCTQRTASRAAIALQMDLPVARRPNLLVNDYVPSLTMNTKRSQLTT